MKSLFVSSAVVAAFVSVSAFADTKIPFSSGLELSKTDNLWANCPTNDLLTVKGSIRNYEGGAEIGGGIELTRFASNVQFDQTSEYSVTWSAKLKPQYAKCVAYAYENSKVETKIFYIAFSGGNVYFTLYVDGLINKGIPAKITYQNIKSGIPVFRYAIAD